MHHGYTTTAMRDIVYAATSLQVAKWMEPGVVRLRHVLPQPFLLKLPTQQRILLQTRVLIHSTQV